MNKKHYSRGFHPNSRKALTRARHRFNSETAQEAAKMSASRRKALSILRSSKALRILACNTLTDYDLETVTKQLIALARAGNLDAFRILIELVDTEK